MGELTMGFQGVIDGNGLELAFAGMVIVFASLSLISTVVALLPLILKVIAKYLPEKVEPVATPRNKTGADDAVIAAIAFANHNHLINSKS